MIPVHLYLFNYIVKHKTLEYDYAVDERSFQVLRNMFIFLHDLSELDIVKGDEKDMCWMFYCYFTLLCMCGFCEEFLVLL